MSEPAQNITPNEAAHTLWHYNGTGRRPGPFTAQLIVLIVLADHANRRRLARVYPGYAAAIDLAENNPSGTRTLERIAYGHPHPDGRSTGHAGDRLAADISALRGAAQIVEQELIRQRAADKATLQAHVDRAEHDYDTARDEFLRGDGM